MEYCYCFPGNKAAGDNFKIIVCFRSAVSLGVILREGGYLKTFALRLLINFLFCIGTHGDYNAPNRGRNDETYPPG